MAGGAVAIVTGDDDLLDLETHAGIRIVTPATFAQTLGEGAE